MVEHKPRGEYNLDHEELSSSEMVFIALTLLESRGYPGFLEMMSVINDPTILMKLLRLFYGMTIKFPSLEELRDCLRASEYIFSDMHKKVNDKLYVKPLDIRNHMGIDEKEEQKLLNMFDDWIAFMHKNGNDVLRYMGCNRQNTKKRIAMVQSGRKWKAKKY